MSENEARAFLEELYNAVCDPRADLEVTNRYFTDDFVQIVDDTIVDRAGFDAHLAALRADLATVSFEFTTVIAEGDRIADVHLFRATRKDGGQITMKFIGVYTLRDGKIARFEELSHLIEGAEEDRDLGSRTR